MKAAEKAVGLARQNKAVVPVHEFSKEAELILRKVEETLTGIVEEKQKRFFAIKLLDRVDKIGSQMERVPDVSTEIQEMEILCDERI